MKRGPRSAGGRQAAFELLYQRHQREVWALAYARWFDADLAMDLTQEAFLRLWKKWQEGEIIENPRAWLVRVTRNLAEDHGKSAFHKNGTQPPQWLNSFAANGHSPLDRLERDETFADLRKLLAEMPEADRRLLTLRYGLDYDARQIAELLGINATAVHMRLTRARQRLGERLSAVGVDSST
jgi:RNA polymerase sigma-70 factor (ECF subfamily)